MTKPPGCVFRGLRHRMAGLDAAGLDAAGQDAAGQIADGTRKYCQLSLIRLAWPGVNIFMQESWV